MKKDFIQTTKIIILGLTLTAGFAFAYSWTPPTSSPTAGNTTPPINSSGIDQYKTGALGVGPLAVFGKSWLWGDVSISPNIVSDLYVSGKVGIGTTSPTEKLDIVGKVRIFPLSGYSSYMQPAVSINDFGLSMLKQFHDAPVRLCADSTGKIVNCPKGGIYFSGPLSASPWTVPDGVFRILVLIVPTSASTDRSGIYFGPYPNGSYILNVLPGTIFNITIPAVTGTVQIAW